MIYFQSKSSKGLNRAHVADLITQCHLGIRPIYGIFVKSLCHWQSLQFHGDNFTAVRTSNQCSCVAVTRRLFGLAGEKRFNGYLGSYMEAFRSSGNFANQNFHIQGDPWELTKSIGLLHRLESIPGPIIRGGKFTDARTFWYSMVTINTNDFLNCFFIWLQFH